MRNNFNISNLIVFKVFNQLWIRVSFTFTIKWPSWTWGNLLLPKWKKFLRKSKVIFKGTIFSSNFSKIETNQIFNWFFNKNFSEIFKHVCIWKKAKTWTHDFNFIGKLYKNNACLSIFIRIFLEHFVNSLGCSENLESFPDKEIITEIDSDLDTFLP